MNIINHTTTVSTEDMLDIISDIDKRIGVEFYVRKITSIEYVEKADSGITTWKKPEHLLVSYTWYSDKIKDGNGHCEVYEPFTRIREIKLKAITQ
jgi:hypothetical protein